MGAFAVMICGAIGLNDKPTFLFITQDGHKKKVEKQNGDNQYIVIIAR